MGVHLNVGGVKYQSTYETLCHSALFASLLRMKPDKEEIFVDRDGVPFKYILSFLRSISVGLFSRHWAMSVLEHLPYVDKLAIMESCFHTSQVRAPGGLLYFAPDSTPACIFYC